METIIAAILGAVAAIIAAVIRVKLKAPDPVVVDQEGRRSEHSQREVDAAIKALSQECWRFEDSRFSTLDVLSDAFAVILHSRPNTGPSYAAGHFLRLTQDIRCDSAALPENTCLELSRQIDASGSNNIGPLCEEAAHAFNRITASLIGFNIIEHYSADSQYHSRNHFQLTDFGAAIMKHLKIHRGSNQSGEQGSGGNG